MELNYGLKNYFKKKLKSFKNSKFLIVKFINLLMKNGKKSKSEKIFFDLFKFLSLKYKKFPILILFNSLKNISPLVIMRTVKVKGKSFQVPFPLKESKQIAIGIKWLIKESRNIKLTQENSFILNLIEQIDLAYQKKGNIFDKKNELHELAKNNRLFAGYRWF